MAFTDKYIGLADYKTYTVINILSKDWCDQFLRLNDEGTYRFEGDLSHYKLTLRRSVKFTYINMVLSIALILEFFLIIGLPLFKNFVDITLIFILIGTLITLSALLIYQGIIDSKANKILIDIYKSASEKFRIQQKSPIPKFKGDLQGRLKPILKYCPKCGIQLPLAVKKCPICRINLNRRKKDVK